jgi:hypothetical protein
MLESIIVATLMKEKASVNDKILPSNQQEMPADDLISLLAFYFW